MSAKRARTTTHAGYLYGRGKRQSNFNELRKWVPLIKYKLYNDRHPDDEWYFMYEPRASLLGLVRTWEEALKVYAQSVRAGAPVTVRVARTVHGPLFYKIFEPPADPIRATITVPDPETFMDRVAAWAADFLRTMRAKEYVAHMRGSLKMRYPRRLNARKAAMNWTTTSYVDACNAMRSGTINTTGIVRALEAYFKHAAPRAPAVPRAATGITRLYRGVADAASVYGAIKPGSTLVSNGGCYTAFSADESVARRFALKGDEPYVVFVLDVAHVARGTPWAWFLAEETALAARRGNARRNLAVSTFVEEREILLPPGSMYVHEINKTGGVTYAHIYYYPDQQYLRRALLQSRAPVTFPGTSWRPNIAYDPLARRVSAATR